MAPVAKKPFTPLARNSLQKLQVLVDVAPGVPFFSWHEFQTKQISKDGINQHIRRWSKSSLLIDSFEDEWMIGIRISYS